MSSRSLRPLGRKLGVAALSATLGLAGLGLAANPAAAAEVETVTDDCGRLAGQTRFGTAGAIAGAYDATSNTDTAIIANGMNFPDALAASGLARELDAFVLLVTPDTLPLETRSALEDRDVSNVVIVGGTDAVGANVATALDADYDVRRVAGVNRYETAHDIAVDEIAEVGELDGLRTAIIATGLNYPDALAGGPIAYHGDGTNPFPILLTAGSTIPAETTAALNEHDIEQVIILGGTDVVPATVQAALVQQTGNPAIRLAGTTREGTAAEVAEFAVAELGFDADAVLLADGRLRFPSPDALTGGPLGGLVEAPILLVNPGMPAQTEAFIEATDSITQVIALGGTEAISADVLGAGCEAAGRQRPGDTNQTFTVTPGERAVNTVSGATGSATANRGARQYSVAVTGTEPVDIALFDCADVRVAQDGTVTFVPNDTTATGTNRWAQRTTTEAAITVVNGVATGQTVETAAANTGYVNNVAPSNGSVTFTINSDAVECVVPVVFRDAQPTAAGDNNLQLGADNQPTEAFGIGGQKQWIPADATPGAFGPDTVEFVDTELNLFVVDGATYRYEEGDIFQLRVGGSCVATSLANFEANLSVDDEVGGVYAPGPNTQSTFCLEDLAPSAPQNVTATSVSPTSVLVDWDASALGDIDRYNVFRATHPAQATTDTTNCPDPNATTGNIYTQVASVPGSTTQYTDTGLTTGTRYCYAVSAVDGQEETARVAATPLTGVRPAADATRPVSNNIELITDAGFTGIMDSGDIFRVGFNEQMEAPGAGDTIRVQDTDATATVADVICGTNATCTLNAAPVTVDGVTYQAGTVITVQLTGSPTIVTAGTTAGIQYPADVINSSGIVDTSGNSWNVPASPDVRIAAGTTTTPGPSYTP